MDSPWPALAAQLERYPLLANAERAAFLRELRDSPPLAGWPEPAGLEQIVALLQALYEVFMNPLAGRDETGASLRQLVTALLPKLMPLSWQETPGSTASRSGDPEVSAAEPTHNASDHLGQPEPTTDAQAYAVRSRDSLPLRRVLGELAGLYHSLGPQTNYRSQLVRILAAVGSPAALETVTELLVTAPPETDADAEQIFLVLWQLPEISVDSVFPRLLEGLEHKTLAPLILEFATRLHRRGIAPIHPAAARVEALTNLFGELADRLGRLEEHPQEFAENAEELTQVVNQSVSLAVAVADCLGFLGSPQATSKLRRAFLVTHRRVRAEAAAAVARLGEEEGIHQLAALAADPGVRLRALAYLDELGHPEAADERYRSPEARAGGELALALAQPAVFGLAPSEIELVDHRHLRWPGYQQAVPCFLLRYRYQHPQGRLEGIGLAGPLTHALRVPLEDFPPRDIYAIYCGWSVEHPQITRTAVAELPSYEQATVAELESLLQGEGFEEVIPLELVHFFGDSLWILAAKRRSPEGTLTPGVVALQGESFEFHPSVPPTRALTPEQVYYLHAGRKILMTFNDPEALQ